MLNSYNVKEIQIYWVFSPILPRKTCQCHCIIFEVIDELQHLSLSKSCTALCHKSIYEIAIFHSINRETRDKYKSKEKICLFCVSMIVISSQKCIISLTVKSRVKGRLQPTHSEVHLRKLSRPIRNKQNRGTFLARILEAFFLSKLYWYMTSISWGGYRYDHTCMPLPIWSDILRLIPSILAVILSQLLFYSF